MMMDLSRIKTPFFLLDEAVLEAQVEKIYAAIEEHWNNTLVGYSVKTNSLPYLASFFRKHGIWAETVSEDEYDLMSRCGYEGSRIICNGPIKSFDFICRLLDAGSMLNIDSHTEINDVIKYKQQHPEKVISVGLRVNLDVREIDTDNIGGRFGFSYESGELAQVVSSLQSHGVNVAGFHLHTGCLSGTLRKYEWLTERFCHIVNDLNISHIRYIDYGGGFYGFMESRPQWEEYFKVISETLKSYGFTPETLQVIIEPGASLMAGVFSYYTRVTDIKENTRESFAFCDGSRVHIDPLMHKQKTSYTYRVKKTDNYVSVSPLPQTLVGYTCMEGDRIMKMDDDERLNVGDVIVFEKVGSYTSTLSPLFISYFPAVYSMQADGDCICVRDRWGVHEFVQKSVY